MDDTITKEGCESFSNELAKMFSTLYLMWIYQQRLGLISLVLLFYCTSLDLKLYHNLLRMTMIKHSVPSVLLSAIRVDGFLTCVYFLALVYWHSSKLIIRIEILIYSCTPCACCLSLQIILFSQHFIFIYFLFLIWL